MPVMAQFPGIAHMMTKKAGNHLLPRPIYGMPICQWKNIDDISL